MVFLEYVSIKNDKKHIVVEYSPTKGIYTVVKNDKDVMSYLPNEFVEFQKSLKQKYKRKNWSV